MLRGIGIGDAQLAAQGVRLEMLASNLAQVDTPGYCQDQMSEKTFSDVLLNRIDSGIDQNHSAVGPLSLGETMSQPSIDLSPGPIESTGRPLDVAVAGGGFFVVQAPDGLRYTRRGAFHQNGQGQLVSLEGWPVLGQKGPMSGSTPLSISQSGQVSSGTQVIDQLRVVTFPNNAALVRKDGTYLVPANTAVPQAVTTPNILTGTLEGSNVDLSSMITNMMAAARSYQVAERAVSSEDNALGQLIDQVNVR